MKIVVCEDCGAKYQLDDSDDIDAFECSSCTGKLKELESFSVDESSADADESSDYYDDSSDVSGSVLVFCTNCGLKFQIGQNDNVNDFECSSCGGPLDYYSDESAGSEDIYYETDSQSSYETDSQSDVYYDDEVPVSEGIYYTDDSYDSSEVYEIIPIHAESNISEESESEELYVEEYEPSESEELYVEEYEPSESEELYVEETETDPSDEVYVEEYYEPSESDNIYVEEFYDTSDSESKVDEIYVEDFPSDDLQGEGYVSSLPDIDELESAPGAEDAYYSSEYPAYDGYDEIIPIHAEKRQLESDESGFEFNPLEQYTESHDDSDEYYAEEIESELDEAESEEAKLVEVTDIPEDELPETPLSLSRQALSEEDQKLFERVQNQLVFDSPEEYEAFKAARYKYYVALLDILKEEYIISLEDELKANRSVKNLIKKGGETVKQSNLSAGEDDALVSKETVEMMKNNNRYEPKKSNADIIIIAGLFMAVVSLAYYYFVSQIMYVLIAFALGLVIFAYGVYRKYTFNEYLARGRIIRERLLALPNDFYVFYAVQPPQSKDIINHVVVGPTGVFTILSQRYDSKDYKNKVKSESETDSMVNQSASIQDYRQKKNTLELQTDYADNQSRFQFGNEEIHFTQNSQIKRKALELNEDLAIFLDKKGFNGIYIEPLIGFVNDDLAILNVILTNEDLFIDELFNKVIRGRRRLDELTVAKIARLLSYYSANCDVY